MRSLVAYASKYGCTRDCARLLAEQLPDVVDLCDLRSHSPNLQRYEQVVIGSPLYMGKLLPAVRAFCSKHQEVLLEKRLGLFICCMTDEKEALAQLKLCFPDQLVKSAQACAYVGGAFRLSKMSVIDRFITKQLAKVKTDVSRIEEGNIHQLAQALLADSQA